LAKFKTRLSTENCSYDYTTGNSLATGLGAYFLATGFLAIGKAGFLTEVFGAYFFTDLAGEWAAGLLTAIFLVKAFLAADGFAFTRFFFFTLLTADLNFLS
jgi:hypothetical protein